MYLSMLHCSQFRNDKFSVGAYQSVLLFCSIIMLILPYISCTPKNVPKELSKNKEIGNFLEIALKEGINPQSRYVALEAVISYSREEGAILWLNSLLGTILEKNPGDPYGSYYLMAMAEGARDTGSDELALIYLRRLLKNYPDLVISDRSLHLIALEQIANQTDNPHEAIAMREEMQLRFPKRIALGENLYYLAHEYRKIGQWETMYEYYRAFLKIPDVVIPNEPEARANVFEALEFHESRKNWTMVNLEDLVRNIKYAISTQNVNLLRKYQAENFFLMNWTQETSDAFTHIPMNLGTFLSPRVRYSKELDEYSNENEAFLWTAGWTWKIPTWYLYFRRIDYPANPEINGNWEWTGIYLGERL